MFSKSSNEIVSTHGYSDNAVVVWKYPSLKKMATLTGHSLRVLYLAMSPDGETVVTGAGDETLRFWKLFPKLNKGTSSIGGLGSKVQVSGNSNLDPARCTIR
jgi:cell division cycle 20-like protein 1, cofactor of APC complex